MRLRATAAMAALLLCAASLGSAQTRVPGPVYGAHSCGAWLAERKGTHWFDASDWVLGWVSAAGYYRVQEGEPSLRETDAAAVSAWVDKYCREHPLSGTKDAAESLVYELSKPK